MGHYFLITRKLARTPQYCSPTRSHGNSDAWTGVSRNPIFPKAGQWILASGSAPAEFRADDTFSHVLSKQWWVLSYIYITNRKNLV